MRTLSALTLSLLLVLTLTGCPPNYRERADSRMRAGRYAEAVSDYRAALSRSPELARDATFAANFRFAQSRADYQQGQKLASQGRWEEAMAFFARSLKTDPAFAQARQAHQLARSQAAKARHSNALALADQGKLDQATAEIRQALALDPQNRDAQNALASVQPALGAPPTQAQRLCQQSLPLEAEKRWGQVAQTLETALRADPNHLPARVARARARAAMASAAERFAAGKRLLDSKRLDEAQAELKRALDIWPYHAEASRLLQQTQAARTEADRRYQHAVQLRSARRWDDAIAAAARVLEVYPDHPQARRLADETKQQAATAHCDTGRGQLARGDPAAAEASFLAALRYVPALAAAVDGLAQADYARGLAAERNALWGNALVWHLLAAEHAKNPLFDQHIAAAKAKLAQRARLGVLLDVAGKWGAPSPDATVLKTNLTTHVNRLKPSLLTIARRAGLPHLPTYNTRVELLSVDVQSRRVQSDNKVHAYTEKREVPNPEIPKLTTDLAAAQADLQAKQTDFDKPCPACTALGKVACASCTGTGQQRCSYCTGTGKLRCSRCKGTGKIGANNCSSCNGTGESQCSRCRGTGQRQCSKCRGTGQITCTRCRGTGRGGTVTQAQLQRAKQKVDTLQRRLDTAPRTALADTPAQWPYVLHTHEKTGLAHARAQVVHPTTGTVVLAQEFRKSSADKDEVVDNPNPAVGLKRDPLQLPSDAEVRRKLLDDLASDTAAKVVAAIVDGRAKELKTLADTLTRDGRGNEATEAYVDLATFIEPAQPKEAASILDQLKASARTHPAVR